MRENSLKPCFHSIERKRSLNLLEKKMDLNMDDILGEKTKLSLTLQQYCHVAIKSRNDPINLGFSQQRLGWISMDS